MFCTCHFQEESVQLPTETCHFQNKNIFSKNKNVRSKQKHVISEQQLVVSRQTKVATKQKLVIPKYYFGITSGCFDATFVGAESCYPQTKTLNAGSETLYLPNRNMSFPSTSKITSSQNRSMRFSKEIVIFCF